MHVWLRFSNWSQLGVHESHHNFWMWVFLAFTLFKKLSWVKMPQRCVGHERKSGISFEMFFSPICGPSLFQDNMFLLHHLTLLFCVTNTSVFHTSLKVLQFLFTSFCFRINLFLAFLARMRTTEISVLYTEMYFFATTSCSDFALLHELIIWSFCFVDNGSNPWLIERSFLFYLVILNKNHSIKDIFF